MDGSNKRYPQPTSRLAGVLTYAKRYVIESSIHHGPIAKKFSIEDCDKAILAALNDGSAISSLINRQGERDEKYKGDAPVKVELFPNHMLDTEKETLLFYYLTRTSFVPPSERDKFLRELLGSEWKEAKEKYTLYFGEFNELARDYDMFYNQQLKVFS